ncbi:MAG: Hsp70 family protein [Aphanocapsa sp. GSE-SYN-MK-11-07L]|jgi:molecular chaperone DnaK|nr:Hsp70 family protein [Aphanocapsa sp. GSE-SYN-MK-11-07L]
MGSVIGIDLGTTNSVAAFKFADVEVVTAESNRPPERKLTRSIVALHQNSLLVGETAYNQIQADPKNVVASVKRLMGREFSDSVVQKLLQQFACKISQPESGTDQSLVVWLGSKAYEPEDISAEILKKVIQNSQDFQAKRGQHSQITGAVITIPAYFNDKQRYATRTAASRAGLSSVELLPEPTAAAISYGFRPDSTDDVKTILVYDFGGGTFDASVITVAGNQFIELGKAGDLWLGGDDVDQMLMQHVKQAVEKEESIESVDALVAQMPEYQRIRFIADLKKAVEQAKVDLSNADSALVIPSTPLIDDIGLAVPINVKITRAVFESLLLPVVERTIKVCHDAIALSEYTDDLIDAVLLVGGSSQIPLVQRKVQEAFGANKVVVHQRPMTAIAEGAALVAAGLTEKVGSVSRDYFIELADEPLFKLISRGDILPIQTSYTFKTVADGQRLIHFKFFNRDAERNVDEPIGQMWLGLKQYYSKGTEVAVSVELDEKVGDLCITAALKNDPSVRVSSSFSRGKADEKIYEELVQMIQNLNDRQLSASAMEEISQKIVPLVETANQVIDHKTGQARTDVQQHAEQELGKIKASVSTERNQAEFFVYVFDFFIEHCHFLFDESQLSRIRRLQAQLQQALDHNDLSGIHAYCEEAELEMERLPELVVLVRASQIAIHRANAKDPTAANSMADKLGRMLAAMERGDSREADLLWQRLQPEVSFWFDQSLPTGSIATGISR